MLPTSLYIEDVPATNATGQVTVNYRDYSEQVFKGCAISYRELPSTLTEVVKGLQRCFSDPRNQLGRLGIDIRRSTLITDAMKEAKKMNSVLTRNSRCINLCFHSGCCGFLRENKEDISFRALPFFFSLSALFLSALIPAFILLNALKACSAIPTTLPRVNKFKGTWLL